MAPIVVALLLLLPLQASAVPKAACEAHLGSWAEEISWRVDSGENLTGDYVYTRQFVDARFVRELGGLDQKIRLEMVNRLNLEWRKIKQNIYELDLDDLSDEQQEAKQPVRNRQLMRMMLVHPELVKLMRKPTLVGVENFLSLFTSGVANGKLGTTLKTVRQIQKTWAQDLRAGEWIEIFGSWPNLEANGAHSDVDIFLSRNLERIYRRAIRGGMLESGTLSRPIRVDKEAQLVRNLYLNFEEPFRAVIGRATHPGHLLSVALRTTTVHRGAVFIDEREATFRRFLTMISPISFYISKTELKLRIHDGISPGKDRGSKVVDIDLLN